MSSNFLVATQAWLAKCAIGPNQLDNFPVVAWDIDHNGNGRPIIAHGSLVGFPETFNFKLVELTRG